MKLLPAIITLAVTMIAGLFIGQSLAESDFSENEDAFEQPSSEEVQAIARKRALELIRAHVASQKSATAETAEEKDARFNAGLDQVNKGVKEMGDIMARTEGAVDRIGDTLADDLDPGERIVVQRAVRKLDNKFSLGKTLLNATEDSVRREGLRLLGQAAEEGNLEALKLIMASLRDSDTAFAREALRQVSNLARSDKAVVKKMIANSELESELVGLLPTMEGTAERSVLTALTALKSTAAISGWRTIFAKESTGRNRITAARSLKELGSDQEYNQMITTYDSELSSEERRVARQAVNNLRSLGGDGAKSSLKRALDANPEGPNAGTIKRALRRLERPQTGRQGWAGFGGGRGGRNG